VAEDGVARQHDLAYPPGESRRPARWPLGVTIDQTMGNGFRFREKMGHNAAVEITRRTNAETCCFVQQQGIIRHEEERAGIVMLRIVRPAKLTTLELCDSLSVQVEHDFVMCLQRLAEPREV